MASKVRTRFAPSPTGYLHVGGVRTALFAWLVARQANGQFLLRLEDTDRSRHVEAAEQHIIDSLKWLGMESDEPVVRQSERLEIYKKWAEKLVAKGRAYADPTSETELDKLRAAAKAAKKPFLYREHRPAKPPAWDGSQPLRFKSEPKAYKWHDEVMGDLEAGPEAIDDFILIKSDGFPTYNLAHVVDDYEMQVSHVIRTTEFLPSVPKFLNLYEAFEIDHPLFATPPVILGPDGQKKLSKRDGAKDVLDYKREGFLPAALINFMASLGWNDGSEQEIFSVEELIKKFSLKRVQHSGAHFDERRLLWLNGHYIRELPAAKLSEAAEAFWPAEAKQADPAYRQKVLALVQERLKYLAELPELTRFFFVEPEAAALKQLFMEPVDKQLKKLEAAEIKQLLEATLDELKDSDFSLDDISQRLNGLLEKLGSKPGILFAAIRIAISGSPMSPEISGTLAVLGKDKSLKRLEQAIDLLAKVDHKR